MMGGRVKDIISWVCWDPQESDAKAPEQSIE
jgi:hypothetical protein